MIDVDGIVEEGVCREEWVAEEGHGGGDVDDQGMAISGRTNREPCVYASDRERERQLCE